MAKLTTTSDRITTRGRVAVAGFFQQGYRHPDGPELAMLDLTFMSRLVGCLGSDAAPVRSLPPGQIADVYRRMSRSRLTHGMGWEIPGLREAEGDAVCDILDSHYGRGLELAAAEAAG